VHRRPAALLVLLAIVVGSIAIATKAGRSPEGPRPAAAAAATPPPVPAGGGYFPLDPVTVAAATRLAPYGSMNLPLTGAGGVPPGGVEAVALSLTAAPAASGRLAVAGNDLPPGPDDPAVALSAGAPTNARLVVTVPSDGRVRLANLAPGATTVSARVGGYYAAPCDRGGAGYVPAGPDRAAPRTAALGPGEAAVFPVSDAAGLASGAARGAPAREPSGPDAVALQVWTAEEAAASSLRVGPDEQAAAAEPAAGFRLVKLGPSGRVRVANESSGRATVMLRVRGWYRRGGGTSYRTAGPEPLLDTTIPAGETASFAAAGVAGVPAGGVGAVALEMQAAGAAAGAVELAGGAAMTLARGRAASGFDLAPPGPGGRLTVRNATTRPARVTVRARGYQGAPAPLRSTPDPDTLAVFDRGDVVEPGWTGGDGNLPVRLPDGRTAWLFGDSFVGTIRSDGSRPPSPLVRNALVVQDGRRLETRVGPADPESGHPTALLAPPPEGSGRGGPGDPEGVPRTVGPQGDAPVNREESGTWLWPGAGLVDGGTLQVFLQEFRRPAGTTDPAAFEWTGRNLLALLSLPDLVPQGASPVYGGTPGAGGVGWGTAVLQEADFTYLYGLEDTGPPLHVKYVHLARFPRGGARGFWTFWDGAAWSPDPARSARLLGAPARPGAGRLEQVTGTPSGVVVAGASYLELSIPDGGHEVVARLACSPTGPWGPPRVLYRMQERGMTYLARAYRDGPGLLLAYSRAPLDGRELYARASAYLPGFVRVR
jgi:hypothetical protein